MKNTTEIPNYAHKTLSDLDAEIKVRQTEIQQLLAGRSALMELYEIPAGVPMGNVTSDEDKPQKTKRGRQPKTAPAGKLNSATPPPGALSTGKPDTISGAMKQLLRDATQSLTAAQIRDLLNADADYAKLMAEGSPTRISGNLAYWTQTAKISKTGDGEAATYRNVAF